MLGACSSVFPAPPAQLSDAMPEAYSYYPICAYYRTHMSTPRRTRIGIPPGAMSFIHSVKYSQINPAINKNT